MDKDVLRTRCTQTAGPLVKVLQSLQSTLGYQYHASWSLSLQVLSTLIQTLADSCSQQLVNVCVIDLTTVKHCCGSISHQTSHVAVNTFIFKQHSKSSFFERRSKSSI